jgi:hypothetical protein
MHAAHLQSREPAHRLRHRPAQPWLTHGDSRNYATGKVRREAAARDFDFREFRHARLLLVRGTKYT